MLIEFFMCDAANPVHVANTRDTIDEFIADVDGIVHSAQTTFASMPPDDDHPAQWTMMTVTLLYHIGPHAKGQPLYRQK